MRVNDVLQPSQADRRAGLEMFDLVTELSVIAERFMPVRFLREIT